jgi:tetratricopeptide (TPR) repeat protein
MQAGVPVPATGYSARDAAGVVGLSVEQVRAYVRSGFLAPTRGPRQELRFTFADLVLLRAAKGLVEARIPSRRVRAALRRLREQLPDRPLTGVHISADGDRVVVSDGGARWQPESGQFLLDFCVDDLRRRVAPLSRAAEAPAEDREADGWYNLGCDLETEDAARARAAYQRALAVDPTHVEALVNLGRLLHEAGDLRGAERSYRRALEARPHDAVAAFDLGVALEDQGRGHDAAEAYRRAIAEDPGCADAHYNLGRLCERLGRRLEALQHLATYRKLTEK